MNENQYTDVPGWWNSETIKQQLLSKAVMAPTEDNDQFKKQILKQLRDAEKEPTILIDSLSTWIEPGPIFAIKPTDKNIIKDIKVNYNQREDVYIFEGRAIDDYQDKFRIKPNVKDLKQFFESVYYGDQHSSVKMDVVEVAPHKNKTLSGVFCLVVTTPYGDTLHSNSALHIQLSNSGFKVLNNKEIGNFRYKRSL